MATDSRAIASIIDGQWQWILANCNSHQIRMLQAIRVCRTPAMGGHLYACNNCGAKHYRYNSCRNRHCSQCQQTQKQRWIQKQENRLLPCPYFHLVFTIPQQLNAYCLFNPQALYKILFTSAWQTLNQFAWNHKYLGAQIGATMILHTWGSNLSFHPHIHCIIPAGGISIRNQWKEAKGKGRFLFPVKALSNVFRAKFLRSLKDRTTTEQSLIDMLFKKDWVVYAKPPFGGAKAVIKYLARYTHNIAISHHRILGANSKQVLFSYTDYRHRNQKKKMRLANTEFVRRFAMHILPRGFRRIRHYGILSSVWKKKVFPELKKQTKIDWKTLWKEKGLDVSLCTRCKKGQLILLEILLPVRGPPRMLNNEMKKQAHKKTENKR
jgi:hypothetical protein